MPQGFFRIFYAVPFWVLAVVVVIALFVAIVVAMKMGWASLTRVVGWASITTVLLTAGWIIHHGQSFFVLPFLQYAVVQVLIFLGALVIGAGRIFVDREEHVFVKWMVCFPIAFFLAMTLLPGIVRNGTPAQWLVVGSPWILWLLSTLNHYLCSRPKVTWTSNGLTLLK